MRQLFRILLCAALVCAFVAGGAAISTAQTVTTGTLTGVVTDAQKGVLPGAMVTAVHTPTGTTYEAVAQADGRFTMLAVRVGGPYTVKAAMSGFKTEEQSGITVGLGESRTVQFTLQIASVTETVNVVAEAQVIDTQRAGTATNVSTETIQNLPTIARSITDYARTSPYFVVNPVGNDAQSMTVAGRNDRYNNIQIDGAVNNDVFGLASSGTPGGQASAEPISLDAIQELQLVVSAYDVRQGGFSGGSVNAITKSGTNNLHGTVYYFGRNQNLVGKGPNDKAFSTFTQKQGGGSLGGPIVKNKLFFFGNGEVGRKNAPSGTSIASSGNNFGHQADVDRFLSILKNKYGYDPGSTDEYIKPTNNNKFFIRGDVNVAPGHQLTIRHNYVKGSNDIGSPSVRSFIFPDNFYRFNTKTNSTVTQLNSTIGRSSFNELRFTVQRIREFRGSPTGARPFPQVSVTLSDQTSLKAGTEQYSGANALDQNIYELTDDFTLVRGTHTFTVGTHNEFYSFRNLYIRDYFGTYSFNTMDLFDQGLAQTYDYSYGTNDAQFAARFKVRQFGVYAGDQWRVKPRFSLNYGVRLDAPSFPTKPTANPLAVSTYGYATDVAPAPKMWSPRVGFNWQISETSRTQLRGGIGLFSGRTPYVWLSNQYGNTGIEISRISVRFASGNRIPFVADPTQQPKTVPNAQSIAGEIDMVDPNYKYPTLLRGNIAFDRELGILGLVGSAELLFSNTVNDVKYQNLNIIPCTQNTASPASSGCYNNSVTKVAATTRPDGRPIFSRMIPALGDGIFLTNTDQGSQWSLALKVQKPWTKGFMASASYMYNQAHAITDGTSSQASSNWGYNYVPGDPNNPPMTVSTFDVRHRINLSGSYMINLRKVTTTLSLFYNGQSGRPYALAFYLDPNNDGRTSNDLLYVPSDGSQVFVKNGTADQLMAWLQADPCAMQYAGGIQPRNSCRMPWTNQMDFRLAFGIPAGGRRKAEVTLDVFNFLNMFGNNLGKVMYTSNNANTDIRYDGIDATTGKMIYNISSITAATYPGRFLVDDVRSRWQAQFGVRFTF